VLIAFHGDKAIKEKYLARVEAHRVADEIIHGEYWRDGKGCAVGCTVHSSSHAAYETELGIPRLLARLEDGIFESIPNGRSKLWPEQFLSAIPVGADLSLVWPRFAVWMLVDPEQGVIQFARSDRSRKSIQAVADAYAAVINGDGPGAPSAWRELRTYAYRSFYADADDAAADDAAAAAADADADDAAADADDADDAAARLFGAAWTAARIKRREAQADKLLELLAAAPVAPKVEAA